MLKIDCTGVLKSMNTIIMLNICSEFPLMYIPIAFMGSDFAGAIATSHAFFSLRLFVSSVDKDLFVICFAALLFYYILGLYVH